MQSEAERRLKAEECERAEWEARERKIAKIVESKRARERALQKEALLSLQESARLSFPTRPQGPKVTKVAGGMNPTGPFTPTTTRTAAAGSAATSSAADDAASSAAADDAATSTAADEAASTDLEEGGTYWEAHNLRSRSLRLKAAESKRAQLEASRKHDEPLRWRLMMMILLALMVLIPGALRLYTPQQSAAVETSVLDRSAYANMDGHYRKTQEQEGRDSEPNRPLEHRPKEWV